MKRALAVILATFMLLLSLVSCSPKAKQTNTESQEPLETTLEEATDEASDDVTDENTENDIDNNIDSSDTEKKIPAYQGMTVVKNLVQARTLMLNGLTLLSDRLSGDVNQADPFGNGTTGDTIESKVKEEFPQTESDLDGYFMAKNSQVYVLIHLENPDKYEITSFTLNNKEYTKAALEQSSDHATLILKYDVANTDITLTLDTVKYLDGSETKNVKMDGNKTVKVNVIPDNSVNVTVNKEAIDNTTVTVNADVEDKSGIISKSNGKIYFVFFDGKKLLKCLEYTPGNDVAVSSLSKNTVYQYAIVACYDVFDGSGTVPHILFKKAIRTTNKYIPPEYISPISGDNRPDWENGFDFEGEELSILVRNDFSVSREWSVEVADDELEEQILIRNEYVESNLNLDANLTYMGDHSASVFTTTILECAKLDILNNTHEIDILAGFGSLPMSAAYRDLWANLVDTDLFPNFDFNLPCWNQSMLDNGMINGRLYSCVGDLNLSMIDSAMAIWYNRDLYQSLRQDTDPTDIQDLVIDGTWTYSELYRWACYWDDKNTSSDISDDTFGLYMGDPNYPNNPVDAIPYAWGVSFISQSDNGTHYFNLENNERASTALTSLRNLYLADGVAIKSTGASDFTQGNILFKADTIYWSSDYNTAIRQMNNTRLLPWPKLDTSQTKYTTTTHDYATMIYVLDHSESTVPTKGEAISAYLEHSTEYTYTHIRGYYFQTIIKPYFYMFTPDETYKYSQKPIYSFIAIVEGITYDIGNIYAPMLDNVITSAWRLNVVNSDGTPMDTELTYGFDQRKAEYKACLEFLDEWFELTSE